MKRSVRIWIALLVLLAGAGAGLGLLKLRKAPLPTHTAKPVQVVKTEVNDPYKGV